MNTAYGREIISFYGADPREIPLYGISQAARYLSIPTATLHSWTMGRKYPVGQQREMRDFKPIIIPPDPNLPMLSFINLMEAHVLSGMRRIEGVPFYKVRSALEYLDREIPSPHPLIEHHFETDGVDLFVRRLESLIKVSGHGQVVIAEVVSTYLRRIKRDLNLNAVRLIPFLRQEPQSLAKDVDIEEPEKIMIDPLISFGRPVIVGTGIPTDVVADRFFAGEYVEDLAKDYGITPEQVQEAVWYESPTRKAA
ncbi:MAG TPA: DUF433 domain-containing protein [Pyrinomonadaceae bacterium]|nr:DUF433 domain-containing protein [Pyrinomonadaceae bacterium]